MLAGTAGRPSINLAHETPFRLGLLHIEPATRQVRAGDEARTLEPRVMQVLVALGREPGRVVGRDELVARCWDDRVVGDNAINRVVSRLRQLAESFGSEGFQVETIARVGYRLTLHGVHEAAAAAAEPRPSTPPPDAASRSEAGTPPGLLRRSLLLAGLGACAVVAGGVAAYAVARRPSAADASSVRGLLAQAREIRRLGVPGFHAQASALLREATRIAPASAESWGALALTHAHGRSRTAGHRFVSLTVATRDAAERALALDAGQADAAVALTLLNPFFPVWAPLQTACSDTLRRHPGHPSLHDALGQIYASTGRWKLAVTEFDSALEADPLWPWAHAQRARALWSAGRVEEAFRGVQSAAAMWPVHPTLLWEQMLMTAFSGTGTAASVLLDELRQVLPSAAIPFDVLGSALGGLHTRLPAYVEKATTDLLAARGQRQSYSGDTALFLSALGRPDLSLQVLRTMYFGGQLPVSGALQEPPLAGEWMRTDLLFQPPAAALRAHVDFASLTAELGLDSYWQTAQVLPDHLAQRRS